MNVLTYLPECEEQMLDEYFIGSSLQMIERGRTLIAEIPRDLPRDYSALALNCRKKINDLIDRLQHISSKKDFLNTAYQPERIRQFRRIVSEMDFIETVGIAALNRASSEDHKLNLLIDKIAREIKYPLDIPVVTTLSQQYFCIYPSLNLLCIPLTEGNFLLHLPDLYHELAHPIFANKNDPLIEPLQHQHMLAVSEVLNYMVNEKNKDRRRNGPKYYDLLYYWETSWIRWWLEEFFCDLFGIYTLGPAFAWSHLHLAIKRGTNPFDFPLLRSSSHPSDDARMKIMLYAIKHIGYKQEAETIGASWQALLSQIGAEPEPEYYRCYPEHLLEKIALYAYNGIQDIQCRIATPKTNDHIHTLLNDAWIEFWSCPQEYVRWEKLAVDKLLKH